MAGSLGLRRGTPVSGRDLRDWINQAAEPPMGGPGLLVKRAGTQSVIEAKVHKPKGLGRWVGRVVSSATESPNRWTYTVREVLKTSPGYGGWVDRTNGREVTAYSFAEDANTATGVQGHGVNEDNLPGDFATQPIPDGWPVIVTVVTLHTSGGPFGDDVTSKEYWLDRINGIDGTCP